MTSESPAVEVVDILGQVCPSSLLIALRRVNAEKDVLLARSKVLRILTDNRDSVGTITDSVESMGFSVETRKEGDHYAITVSAGGWSGK